MKKRAYSRTCGTEEFSLGEIDGIDDVEHPSVLSGEPGGVDHQFAGPSGRKEPNPVARQKIVARSVGCFDRFGHLRRTDRVIAVKRQIAAEIDVSESEEHRRVLDIAVVAVAVAEAGAGDHRRVARGVDNARRTDERPSGVGLHHDAEELLLLHHHACDYRMEKDFDPGFAKEPVSRFAPHQRVMDDGVRLAVDLRLGEPATRTERLGETVREAEDHLLRGVPRFAGGVEPANRAGHARNGRTATKAVALDQHSRLAQFGGDRGGSYAGGPAADYQDIDLGEHRQSRIGREPARCRPLGEVAHRKRPCSLRDHHLILQ